MHSISRSKQQFGWDASLTKDLVNEGTDTRGGRGQSCLFFCHEPVLCNQTSTDEFDNVPLQVLEFRPDSIHKQPSYYGLKTTGFL